MLCTTFSLACALHSPPPVCMCPLTHYSVRVVAVALAIRGAVKGEVPPTPFILVSLFAAGAMLAAWRGVYVVFNPTSTADTKRGGILDGFRMITTLLRRW
jgi:Protein of unknown function (DUF3054)